MIFSNQHRTHVDLGRTNRREVLALIALQGPLSRTEIATTTDLTNASVSRITRDLIEADLVVELPDEKMDSAQRGPGRRFVGLDINSRGGYALGIGVNVFSQSVTLADLKNRRIARMDLKLGDLSDPDTVISRLIDEANNIIDAHVADRQRLLGASFAITGAVDPAEGVVRTSPYLRWGEVSLGPRLRKALGVPVRIESLPAALAMAENRFGIAQGLRNLLTLNCSLGIGAAMLIDGRLVQGHEFSAGLIGDISPPHEPAGSLDTLAGGHGALLRLHCNGLDIDDIPADRVAKLLLDAIDRAANGDVLARRAMAAAGRVLGQTAAPFVALLRPEAVMIAGPLASVDAYVEAFQKTLQPQASAYGADLLVSTMSAQAAARWVAIGEIFLGRELNMEALKLSKAV
jgi:predicted NBD/HSP70 family sugar kinase